MASALALVAAFLFARAAALQQKGALNLPSISLRHPSSLTRLAGQTMWLVGTVALLTGYAFQAASRPRPDTSGRSRSPFSPSCASCSCSSGDEAA